jgi:RNA polymerase sigma-70 factor (ECF subfamily)
VALAAEVDGRIFELLDAERLDDAVSLVISAHGQAIFGMLVGVFHDEDTASDVFQHFCMELWKSLGSFQGKSSVYTWAYVIARRCVSAHLRGDSKEVRLKTMQQDGLVARWTRTVTDEWRKTETKHRFRELCDGLPEDERMLVMLRIQQKMPWKQIAEVVYEGDEELDSDGLKREASRLRKQFERVKVKLRDAMRD